MKSAFLSKLFYSELNIVCRNIIHKLKYYVDIKKYNKSIIKWFYFIILFRNDCEIVALAEIKTKTNNRQFLDVSDAVLSLFVVLAALLLTPFLLYTRSCIWCFIFTH